MLNLSANSSVVMSDLPANRTGSIDLIEDIVETDQNRSNYVYGRVFGVTGANIYPFETGTFIGAHYPSGDWGAILRYLQTLPVGTTVRATAISDNKTFSNNPGPMELNTKPVDKRPGEELLELTHALVSGEFHERTANLDAVKFLAVLPRQVAAPNFYSGEDDEVTLEWKSDLGRVLVTFEGDGLFGYALMRDDRFVPGETEVERIDQLPEDLADYLREFFWNDDA